MELGFSPSVCCQNWARHHYPLLQFVFLGIFLFSSRHLQFFGDGLSLRSKHQPGRAPTLTWYSWAPELLDTVQCAISSTPNFQQKSESTHARAGERQTALLTLQPGHGHPSASQGAAHGRKSRLVKSLPACSSKTKPSSASVLNVVA